MLTRVEIATAPTVGLGAMLDDLDFRGGAQMFYWLVASPNEQRGTPGTLETGYGWAPYRTSTTSSNASNASTNPNPSDRFLEPARK